MKNLSIVFPFVIAILGGCVSPPPDSTEKDAITYVGLDLYYESPTMISVEYDPTQLHPMLGKGIDSAFATNFTAFLTYTSLTATPRSVDEFARSMEGIGYAILRSTSPGEWDSIYVNGRLRIVTTMELHRKSDNAFVTVIQWDSEYGVLSSEFGKNDKRFLTDFRIVLPDGSTSQRIIQSYGRKQHGREVRFFTRDSIIR